MCFVYDNEWTAEVYEKSSEHATFRCDECLRDIVGTRHHVLMQEYEDCYACAWGECENGEHTFGESFECSWCDDCEAFLKAVEAAEIEAGCKPWHSRPAYGRMIDDVQDGGRKEARRYWKKAVAMGVSKSYLAWLWRRVFV